jgi:type VI secretion system protein ImpM
MAAQDVPGWFGKLATQGDFASRRLTPEWVQSCDDWLSACVATSTRQLGERWLEVYLSAPLWRFAWGPGIAGDSWWFGVLMPSCDNVGRYFPLVVAQAREQAPADRAGLAHLEAWWAHVAAAAMETLAEGASLAGFEAGLHQAPPWPGPARLLASPAAPGAPWQQALPPGVTLAEVAGAVAAAGLQQRLARSTFWWPLGPAGAAGSCTMLAGLPAPETFAAMLGGHHG